MVTPEMRSIEWHTPKVSVSREFGFYHLRLRYQDLHESVQDDGDKEKCIWERTGRLGKHAPLLGFEDLASF